MKSLDTVGKLKLLSDDSQYDLACACGTGRDDRRKRGRTVNGSTPYHCRRAVTPYF